MSQVKTIKFLDKHLGSLICFILSPSKLFYSRKDVSIKNILIMQLWGIGESVLTLPAINILRKKFPKSNIEILLTERNKDIYFKNKDINKIISIKLNLLSILNFILKCQKFSKRKFLSMLKNPRFLTNKYDLVIDMEEYLNTSSIISFFIGKKRIGYSHNIRSMLYTGTIKYNGKQHCSQTFADLLKPLDINFRVNKLIKLNYSSNDEKIIDKILLKNKITKNDFIVGVVPGAAESAKSRMWPKENFVELSNNLIKRKKNIKIIFIGNDEEKELINDVTNKIKEKNKVLNLAGKITLRQLFYLAEKCDLFISNDTGPMHIATAQDVKTIGLFGPNLPVRFGPLNKKSISIYKGEICKFSPCINVHKGEVPNCYYKCKDYQKCMKEIKVGDVLKFV